MTSRYSSLVSIASVRREVARRLDPPSASDSSESDGVRDGSKGGVGGRVVVCKGGKACISFKRS